MGKTKNLKTWVLALVLTALMIVGVLPMTVFAIVSAGNSTPAGVYGALNTNDPVQAEIKPILPKPEYFAPTSAEIQAKLKDGESLLYYNDFNSATAFSNSALKAAAVLGNGCVGDTIATTPGEIIKIGDKGDGDKEISFKNTRILNYKVFLDGDNSEKPLQPLYGGKDFVFSADYKIGESGVTAGQFIVFGSEITNKDHLTSVPVWIDADGKLYAMDPNWTAADVEDTSMESGITGGLVWRKDGFAAEGELTECKKGTYLCTLSKDDYTNVAIQVKDNKLPIYINGAAKATDLTFMSDSAKEVYGGEFAITYLAQGYRSRSTKASHQLCCDNVTFYIGDTFIAGKMKTIDDSIYHGEIGKDATGYIAESGAVYYYENGEKVANKVSADGILTIDADGKVFYGETAVTTMQDYYRCIGTEIVPVDGIYSGIYQGNLILGANEGNMYYYDTSNKLVTDKAVYDIKDDNGNVTDEAVAYVIDENGVVTGLYSGKATLAGGARIYENGVRKTGFITLAEKFYYAGENEYLITGEKEIGGKMWDFDFTTHEGAIRDGLWIVNAGTDEEYANLYIDGILQTEASAESFGTANPFTYKGKIYYIQPDAGVDGQTNLYKGDGFILIDDLPYLMDGYILTALRDSVYDGKYYDASGSIIKDEFFKGKNKAGETVWYHADTETGELLTGIGWFNDGEGIKYYRFNGLDASEPYVGQPLESGVHLYDFDKDPNTPDTYRYFIEGVMQTASTVVGEYTYIILENGDLGTNEYIDRPDYFDGMWYVKGGEYAYQLVYANGMLVTSDKAPEGEANEHKLFENGVVNYGDANGEFLDGDVLVNKYSPEGSLYYNYVDGVLAADGKTYDFVGYIAVVRDNYLESNDGYVWVGGYKVIDGIHWVPVEDGAPVEMYFKDGKASAGEVPVEDGSIHKFGEDGKRIAAEGDTAIMDKYPHSIIIITELKDGDKVERLSKRELYRFWNTSYTYVPYYKCYGYTITIDGIAVTAAEGEELKAFIEASDENDHVIRVTFDTSVDYHTHYVRVDEECEAATCVLGGTDVYVCNTCGRNGRKTVNTEVDPDNHKISIKVEPATHTMMGVITTACDNDCGQREYEYTPMIAHTWVEGERVEPGCGTTGSVQYSCSCGATKTDTLAATGVHSYDISGKVDPTCSVDGAIYYVCSDCDNTYTVKIPATGIHTHGEYDSYTVIKDVTKGLETRVYNCNTCGAIGIINKTVEVDEEDE